MGFRSNCPVCGKSFFHTCNLNALRKNLTCSPKCRAAQRVVRRRDLRRKNRQEKLKERHRAQVRRGGKTKAPQMTLFNKHTAARIRTAATLKRKAK